MVPAVVFGPNKETEARAMRTKIFGVTVVLFLFFGLPAISLGQDPSQSLDELRREDRRATRAEGSECVFVCHVPPGRPSKAHTICVGESAVDAHLAHGDILGPCAGDIGACCNGEQCSDGVIESECDDIDDGTFQFFLGETCDRNPCIVACCAEDSDDPIGDPNPDDCTEGTVEQCLASGGSAGGPGTRCVFAGICNDVSQEEIEQFNDALPALQVIQSRFEDDILAIPGVFAIGIGRQLGEPVFVVATEFKTPDVPTEIGGIPVIVDVRGPFELLDGGANCNNGQGPPCHANQTSQPPPVNVPVQMGNSARWDPLFGGCTMGFKACDLGTGASVFVMNSHCFHFPEGCDLAPLGGSVKHAADGDDPGVMNFSVGQISGHAAPSCGSQFNFVDATKVDTSISLTSAAHRDIGLPIGSAPTAPLIPGNFVQYSGRSAGYNYGCVVAVGCTVNVPPPRKGFVVGL